MKFSKITWILLATGVLVILVASLGMVYSQQGNEQSRINEEIALAQLRLKKYPAQLQELDSQQEELESRLAEAESQLRTAKISLDQFPQNIEASDALFVIAQNCHVEVTEVSSEGLGTETLEGVTLSALQLTVTVEGDVLNLIDFIHRWTKQYSTGVVKSVAIYVPEPPDEEEEEEIEEEKPSATINLLIYSYEGN